MRARECVPLLRHLDTETLLNYLCPPIPLTHLFLSRVLSLAALSLSLALSLAALSLP